MDWLASWPSLISPRWTLMCRQWYNRFCCSSLDLPSRMTSHPSYGASLMSTLLAMDIQTVGCKDCCPLPTGDELTQSHRSTVVTKLNLCQEYLQVPLRSDSCKLTPFLTHNSELWCKNIAGVSWSSGPSRFQQIVSSVLAGIPGVAICLHDSGQWSQCHHTRWLHRLGITSHSMVASAFLQSYFVKYVGFCL